MTIRPFSAQEQEVWPYVRPLTLSDTADLDYFPQAIRIYNSNGTVATVKMDTVSGDTITLTIPANTVRVEEVQVAKIYSTGTSAGVTIHGLYSRNAAFPTIVGGTGIPLGINFNDPKNSQYLLLLIV